MKNSNVATFFTNRALCYLKLKQWDPAVQDCRLSLEKDTTLVKGHYFLGQALLELGHYDEAINSLIKGKLVVLYRYSKHYHYKKLSWSNQCLLVLLC